MGSHCQAENGSTSGKCFKGQHASTYSGLRQYTHEALVQMYVTGVSFGVRSKPHLRYLHSLMHRSYISVGLSS